VQAEPFLFGRTAGLSAANPHYETPFSKARNELPLVAILHQENLFLVAPGFPLQSLSQVAFKLTFFLETKTCLKRQI